MPYQWNTREDMIVEVDEGGGLYVPTLAGPSDATERTLGWVASVLRPAAERWMIPLSWLCAICWHESGGNPAAINTASHDYGLMQINRANFTWLGLDETTALDPARNVEAACKLIDALGNSVTEWPMVISGYNAGLDPTTYQPYPSERSAWNMRETGNTISEMVAASNWFIRELKARGLEAHYGGGSKPVPGAVATRPGGSTSPKNSKASTGGAGLLVVGALVAVAALTMKGKR